MILTENLFQRAVEALDIIPEGGLMISYKNFMEFGADLGIQVRLKAFKPDEKGNVTFESWAIKINDKTKQEFWATITEEYPDALRQDGMQKEVSMKALKLCINAHYPELLESIGGAFAWATTNLKKGIH